MAKIEIENKKIAELLGEKNRLVNEGRTFSQRIEELEKEIEEANTAEREVTSKVEPKELIDHGNALMKQINTLSAELEKLGDEIMKIKLAAIPAPMMKRHKDLRAKKEEFERERNKAALKVQKIKDRVTPLVKKIVEPHLGEYEDTETVEVIKGVIVINTFSHLEEWKKKFQAKAKAQ